MIKKPICLRFINMPSSSEEYLSFGLRVNPQSAEWYESLTKILKIIKGATYTIDAEQGMALVSGRANSKSILKKLKKSGLEVAWIKTGKPNTYGNSHGHGYYETDPYHHQYPNYQYAQPPNYHSNSSYNDPYAPNPPHFEPYNYYSSRYY